MRKIFRNFILLFLFTNVLWLSSCGSDDFVEEVVIEKSDKVFLRTEGLEEIVRDNLGKSEGVLTKGDLLQITELYKRIEIKDFSELKYFRNLEVLYLEDCGVENIEGVEQLENLQELYLSNNQIWDITALSNMNQLKVLRIGGNFITNYTPLENLVQLEVLGIENISYIEDVGIISEGDNTNDLAFVRNLTKLKKLFAKNYGIKDISVLANMKDLEYLELSDNEISDIYALEGLENLETLYLEGNNIYDISPLYNLKNIKRIELDNNPISEEDLKDYFSPKDYDNITLTKNEKIRDDMPEFIFELSGYYDREVERYAYQAVKIVESSTGRVVQEISIPELTLNGQTMGFDLEYGSIEFEDFNFDGYTDFKIYDANNGLYLNWWIYFVWNNEKGVFEHDEVLARISGATFDNEKKLIYGRDRGGVMYNHYTTYSYINDKITLMQVDVIERQLIEPEQLEKICKEFNLELNEDDVMIAYETEEVLDEKTGRMVIKRDEYVMYEKLDANTKGEKIVSFDKSSELGQMLW